MSPVEWPLLPAGWFDHAFAPRRRSQPTAGPYIPPRFTRRLLLHVVKNFIPDFPAPLFLAIQGAPGDGKSWQVREACRRYGISMQEISGASLAGPYEKDAVAPLAEAYREAARIRAETRRPALVVVDDVDLSAAGVHEGREYTVNTQLLSVFMMNLADNPRLCEGKPVERVPVVLTGNDFRLLHGPLRRHGRMDFFEWRPEQEERCRVVAAMLAPLMHADDVAVVDEIVRAHAHQPIAFFSALRADLADEAILEEINRSGRIDVEAAAQAWRNSSGRFRAKDLRRLAASREAAGAVGYLGGESPAG